jgi:hypothetical protein
VVGNFPKLVPTFLGEVLAFLPLMDDLALLYFLTVVKACV